MAPIQVETFEDIVRVLREHPEWLEEVRRLILTEELLRLPVRFDNIEQRFDNLERRFDTFQQEMYEFRDEMYEFRNEMYEFRNEMYEFRSEITEEVRTLREDVDRLDAQMRSVLNDLARLKGSDREHYYRSRAVSLFGRYMKNVRLTDMNRLYDHLFTIYESGDMEIAEIAVADLIVEGVGRDSGVPKVVVLEASWKVDRNDVERAIRRAEILQHAGYHAVPAVGGAEIMDDALELALEQGVLVLADGMVYNAQAAS